MPYFECCVDCSERHVGCHSMCERYISDKESHNEKQNKIKQWKRNESIVTEYTVDSVKRMKDPSKRRRKEK